MMTRARFGNLSFRLVLAATLCIAAIFLSSGNLFARTMICNANPDYFSKRCTLHPYAVTKVVAGQIQKSHLIGCQFKSYTCGNGICQDNYGLQEAFFSHSMDDHQAFCHLLCNNPSCNDPLGWQ